MVVVLYSPMLCNVLVVDKKPDGNVAVNLTFFEFELTATVTAVRLVDYITSPSRVTPATAGAVPVPRAIYLT